jgi:hypothetical protein
MRTVVGEVTPHQRTWGVAAAKVADYSLEEGTVQWSEAEKLPIAEWLDEPCVGAAWNGRRPALFTVCGVSACSCVSVFECPRIR